MFVSLERETLYLLCSQKVIVNYSERITRFCNGFIMIPKASCLTQRIAECEKCRLHAGMNNDQ